MKNKVFITKNKNGIRLRDRKMDYCKPNGIFVAIGAFCVVCFTGVFGCEEPVDAIQKSPDVASVSLAGTTKYFGMHCQDTWEDNWKDALTNGTTICSRFSGKLDDEATRKFYFNLVGKQYYWESDGDHATNSLEDVDLFFEFTHGQAAPHDGVGWDPDTGMGTPPDDHNRATWSMWDQGVSARSDNMKLGNEGTGLSIFSQYSCSTLKIDDLTFDRWDNIFKGGLRAVTGFTTGTSWCANYTCPTQLDHGKRYAQYLNNGLTILRAWGDAIADGDGIGFNPGVIFSGNSESDCYNRRDTMTWDNFTDYTRRKGANMTTICGWHWDDLE